MNRGAKTKVIVWTLTFLLLASVMGERVGMAIGPPNVSRDDDIIDQRLDLRGRWRGVLIDARNRIIDVEIEGHKLRFTARPCPVHPEIVELKMSDKGGGAIRMEEDHFWHYIGHYLQNNDLLIIRFHEASREGSTSSPTSEKESGGLFILHRYRP